MHLSTCYVAGEQDGRVPEKLTANYNPHGFADFDAEQEWRSLQELVKKAEVLSEADEVTSVLRYDKQAKEHAAKNCKVRRSRIRFAKTVFAGSRLT